MKVHSKLILIILITQCIAMVAFASVTTEAVRDAIKLWLQSIVPSLFPFFLFSDLIKKLGYTDKLPVGLYPFIMGALSGYPVGAKLAADYYNDAIIDKDELIYILSYSMVTGPAFIISTVGVQFLHSYLFGVIIAIGHYTGGLLNGRIHKKKIKKRKRKKNINEESMSNFYFLLTDCILSSFKSMIIILAYIILFFIFISLFNEVLSFDSVIVNFIYGILEMTIGCSYLGANLGGSILSATISSFIISFGGLSVLFQTMSMMRDTSIKILEIIKIKLMHGILSAILTFSLSVFVVYFIL